MAAITARLCYENNQAIERSPVTGNPAHCDVVGNKPDCVRKNLARAARLLIRGAASDR